MKYDQTYSELVVTGNGNDILKSRIISLERYVLDSVSEERNVGKESDTNKY